MLPPQTESEAPPIGQGPLTQDTTDLQVIESEDKPPALWETDLAKAFVDVLRTMDMEEDYVRYRHVLKWRKHLLYWNSIQYLVESLSDRDWLTPGQIAQRNPELEVEPALYAKVVNVFKAHGEIFIGALSQGLPTVRFFPKDADDPEDIIAAKAFSKISELIQRQNKARLLLMKALFVYYNQGLVACYNENKEDERFGQVHIKEYEDVDIINREHYCPACGYSFGAEQFQPEAAMGGQAQEQAPPQSGPLPMPQQQCPQCGAVVDPEHDDTAGSMQVAAPDRVEPKNREVLEVYGPLNVKIPLWVRDQAGTPYLNLETEESVLMMKDMYPEIADKIQGQSYAGDFEREARVPSAYRNDFPKNICTVSRVWFRPWAYYYFENKTDETGAEIFETLKTDYPNGAYVVIINKEIVAEICHDKLDDHWTITENPLSETLHPDPPATAMVPLQDITNELTNITLETVEFGIGETFADGQVLDFDAYSSQEARPGQITKASFPGGGQSLAAGFHQIKPATLSGEVDIFAERVTTVTQFVMGSYPSVYGGAQTTGSGTAREYELSKSSALQRWSSTWTILQDWWAQVMAKSTRSFAKNMIQDEKFAVARGTNFVSVWIKQIELSGEVGDVMPEVAETFPISWSQKRDVILDMIKLKDPMIAAVLSHPENASLVASIVGVPELFIPGDDDRNKQLAEIATLITQEPIEGPPVMGPMGPIPGQIQSSVPIDPELDNNAVEAEICKSWLVSAVGQDAKKNNPAGYMNVLSHYKEHKQAEQAMMTAMAPAGAPSESQSQPADISGPPNG
jgi:hypothetical protein